MLSALAKNHRLTLTSSLFMPGRHFFIVAVVIILSDGFPLICVYSFCSI